MSPNARRALMDARYLAGAACRAIGLAVECLIVALLTWWDTRDCPSEDREEAFWDG